MDCGVFMADWVVQVCGRDPIADVRGTYSSENEFDEILNREGGFIRSCSSRLYASGFRRTKNPNGGDISIVMAPSIIDGNKVFRPTGSICVSCDMRAVVTSDRGLVISPDLQTLKAWKFYA